MRTRVMKIASPAVSLAPILLISFLFTDLSIFGEGMTLLPPAESIQKTMNSTTAANAAAPSASALTPNFSNSLNSSAILGRNWSESLTQPTIMQAIKSQANATLLDATASALKAVGPDSLAVSSFLQPDVGFVVYSIIVLDSKNETHKVTVDARNGQVLSNVIIPSLPALISHQQLGMIQSPQTSGEFILPAPPPPHGGGFILPAPLQSPSIGHYNTSR